MFNQPNLDNVISVPGGLQTPNTSIIAPLADMWTNTGNAEITYQFSRNGMIGASGTFTNLDYLNSVAGARAV